jgi:hypothetical protein
MRTWHAIAKEEQNELAREFQIALTKTRKEVNKMKKCVRKMPGVETQLKQIAEILSTSAKQKGSLQPNEVKAMLLMV